MPPCGTTMSVSRRSHATSSLRSVAAKATWSMPSRRGENGSSSIPSGNSCRPSRVPPTAKTAWRNGPVSSSSTGADPMSAAYHGALTSMSRTVSATWVIGPSFGRLVSAGAGWVALVVISLSWMTRRIGLSDAAVGRLRDGLWVRSRWTYAAVTAGTAQYVLYDDEPGLVTGSPAGVTAVHRPP